MCGRYALALPPSVIRRRLQENHMPTQDDLEDDDTRQTYNFAPGYYGLVYRADAPDHGATSQATQEGPGEQSTDEQAPSEQPTNEQNPNDRPQEDSHPTQDTLETNSSSQKQPTYKLQAMKWGLVPFWTKRNPDYGTTMKTINCRDDSLSTPGGMWHTMKQKKRCIVLAQGFYEWLKKNGGKDRLPHFVKRRDGKLMCFAGLWDCVQYEDSPTKLYTYTIITTDSNSQLSFLHDRMPVILEPGSDALFTWLDSSTTTWTPTLQSLLKPFAGELECYPVVKDVGKVGNNSPTFIVPLDSKENKQNIANFFGNQKRMAGTKGAEEELAHEEEEVGKTGDNVEADPEEKRKTVDEVDDSENNAPKPVAGSKRQHEDDEDANPHNEDDKDEETAKHSSKTQKIAVNTSPTKKSATTTTTTPGKRSRSATTNSTVTPSKASPTKAGDGSKKITSFFSK